MDNFTAIRNGILEHINAGRLCPFDLGIYVFLHLRADWSTGIYRGCALTIAHGFNDPSLKLHINKSLIRLREQKYINYPKGCGRRGAYELLIHKYHVTVGELSGMRLNAWKHADLCKPEYEPWNGRGRVTEESRKSDGRVEEPIQDLLDIQDVQDIKTKSKASGAIAPCDGLADLVSSIYEAYPRKVGKQAALKAIQKAISKQAKEQNCAPQDAAEFIYSQVVKFAASPAGQRGPYTPYPATWMNDGRYSDDPTEWHSVNQNGVNGNGNSNRAQQLQTDNLRARDAAIAAISAKAGD